MLFKVRFLGLIVIAVVAGVWPAAAQAAVTAPGLGSAARFAVLSAAPGGLGAVTCTDGTIFGDVGSSGAAASVVQTRCSIHGAIVAPVSAGVIADFNTAYAGYGPIACGTVLTGTLAGVSLASGVYCFTAAATLTGTLTLTGSGPWIFKIGTGGTGALTGTGFTVVTSNPCNVNWWVAQASTMTDSNFKGTILAGAAITLTRGTFHGSVLAKAGVTISGTSLLGCGAAGGSGQGCENEDEDGGQTGQHLGQNADRDSEGCNSEDSHQDGADHKVSDAAKVETKVETHVSSNAIKKTEVKSAVKTTLKSNSGSESKSENQSN